MNTDMLHPTLDNYLESLAAKTPTPGGGAVAAVTGAQAAALVSMVCRFSAPPERTRAILDTAEAARTRFLALAEEDARAFRNLLSAYRQESGQKSTESIRKALRAAAEAPRQTMLLAESLVEGIIELEETGNPNLRTDTAIAAVLLEATIISARLNILVNVKETEDEAFHEAVRGEMERCEEAITGLQRVADSIRYSLSSNS